jgi:hypothetical protein
MFDMILGIMLLATGAAFAFMAYAMCFDPSKLFTVSEVLVDIAFNILGIGVFGVATACALWFIGTGIIYIKSRAK